MNDELFGAVNYAELRRGGAPLWTPGIDYAVGDVRRSPANNRIYVRTLAGAGTADPSADASAWMPERGAGALRFTRLTSGAGSFVKLPESTFAIVRIQGAGAHGTAGRNGYVTNYNYHASGNGGTGGGAGMHVERRMRLESSTPYQVGTAGTSGGTTVFGTMRAMGGRSGAGNNTAQSLPALYGATQGGIGGAGGQGSETYSPGNAGLDGGAPGASSSEFAGAGVGGRGGVYNDPYGGGGGAGGGGGGDSVMGQGGRGAAGGDGSPGAPDPSRGENGTGYGAGGGGGGGGRGRHDSNGGAGSAGGLGSGGCIEIEEY